MSINAKEAVEFLVSHKFAFWHGRRLKLTAALYDELDQAPKEQLVDVDWEKRYQDFILAAHVPRTIETAKGETYCVNKFSMKACTAFKRAIIQGFDERILIESTRLYYRSRTTLKMSISRYIDEGYWRSDYNAYVDAEKEGTTAQLQKQETSNGTHTAWSVG